MFHTSVYGGPSTRRHSRPVSCPGPVCFSQGPRYRQTCSDPGSHIFISKKICIVHIVYTRMRSLPLQATEIRTYCGSEPPQSTLRPTLPSAVVRHLWQYLSSKGAGNQGRKISQNLSRYVVRGNLLYDLGNWRL